MKICFYQQNQINKTKSPFSMSLNRIIENKYNKFLLFSPRFASSLTISLKRRDTENYKARQFSLCLWTIYKRRSFTIKL